MKNIAIALLVSTLIVGCGASAPMHSTMPVSMDSAPMVDMRTGNLLTFTGNGHPCEATSIQGYQSSGAAHEAVTWYCF